LLKLFPSESSTTTHLADGNLIYHYNGLPSNITTFASVLNLSLWHDYYKPFAGAIVNQQTHEVVLVRDHLGVVPLYYWHSPGKKLIVGETIPEVLKQLPSTPPFLDSQIAMLFSDHKIYSDETFYQGIYRVEPGHLMHFKSDGSVVKKAFWQLEPHGELLHYDDDQDYLDHFSMLMTESMQNATEHQHHMAAEFSAGLDSSAVYCAARNINVNPKLFMHIALPETKSAEMYNNHCEKVFINHYQLNDIQRIGADDFDPLKVFDDYAVWFAGPAPYLFFMFAANLHRAVAAGGHPILLSGFGGDQGVSGQIPLNFFMPDLIQQGEYRRAWNELSCKQSKIRRALQLAQFMHPNLYALSMQMKKCVRHIKNITRDKTDQISPVAHPYQRRCYNNTREAEWSLLQGPDSHEVRMRIEYSSVLSKKMGFEYRYPLLYPKLLEFMLSLPLEQKRHNGRGRYMLRRYLSQFVPGELFETYKKNEGLGIVPSTFDRYQKNYAQGCFHHEIKKLPYADRIPHKDQRVELRNFIKGYMLKA
jgi:asparagine synthase (glutamine-hydrolysing)